MVLRSNVTTLSINANNRQENVKISDVLIIHVRVLQRGGRISVPIELLLLPHVISFSQLSWLRISVTSP